MKRCIFLIILIFLLSFTCTQPKIQEEGGTLNVTASTTFGPVNDTYKIYMYLFDHFPYTGPSDTKYFQSSSVASNGGTASFSFEENYDKIFMTFYYDESGNSKYDPSTTEKYYLYGENPTPELNFFSVKYGITRSISISAP